MTDENSFRDLYSDLNELEGTELVRELRGLKNSVYTLDENFDDLNEMDVWFQNQGLQVQPMDRLGHLEPFQREYLRRLHNYLTSVYSLIKHTQRINNNFGSDTFQSQYTDELGSRNLTERGEFLRQLRHYTQKRKLPPIEVSLLQEDDGVRFAIVVPKSELMDWDEWNEEAEEYLETVPDEVDIQIEVRQYHEKVGGFYEWYFEEIQKDCTELMAKRSAVMYKIEQKRSELFDGLSGS